MLATKTLVYFAAVDMDCDGASTSLYRIDMSKLATMFATINDSDMAHALWEEIFGGSSYFGPSDLFVIPAADAERALSDHRSIFGAEIHNQWYDHGKYEHCSVKGIVRY